jgi:hypothetical protein
MPLDPDAAHRIRTRLAAGLLPAANIKRIVVVSGSGVTCDACEAPIAQEDRQALVDCVGGSAVLRMHSTCVAIWQFQSALRRR